MSEADEISVALPAELLRAVRASVASGEFASAEDALRDAVGVWRRERENREDRIEEITMRIRRSLTDPRPSLTGDEVKTALEAFHAETLKAHRREAS